MRYVCDICGWVYDEEETGVKWEDLPEDFACELCGAGRSGRGAFLREGNYEQVS